MVTIWHWPYFWTSDWTVCVLYILLKSVHKQKLNSWICYTLGYTVVDAICYISPLNLQLHRATLLWHGETHNFFFSFDIYIYIFLFFVFGLLAVYATDKEDLTVIDPGYTHSMRCSCSQNPSMSCTAASSGTMFYNEFCWLISLIVSSAAVGI